MSGDARAQAEAHRKLWFRAAAVGVVGVLLLGVHQVLAYLEARGYPREEVHVEALSLRGFQKGGRRYESVDTDGDAHLLGFPIVARRTEVYDVRFDVDSIPVGELRLFVDFHGPGYDDPRCERLVDLMASESDVQVRLAVPLIEPPERVSLRVFYTGPPGVTVSNVRVLRLGGWVPTARAGTRWAGIALLVVAALIGIIALSRSRRRPRQSG